MLFAVMRTVSRFKSAEKNGLVSSIICHGTLGVAHIFTRLLESYPEDDVKQARDYWYQKSDEIMQSKIGYADQDSEDDFIEKTGILTGVEGIAMAVLSFLYPEQSDWDYQFLLR